MELIAILRVLSDGWRLVALGALASIVAGLSIGGVLPGPDLAATTRSGVAESKVLVDTRTSYAADLKGGNEVLGSQAALLATEIADEPQREAIAREVGIRLDELDVLVGGITAPKIPSTLALKLAEIVERPRLPYSITVSANSAISIITIDTAAPTRREAAALARSATTALASVTARNAPTPSRSLVIEPLGQVRSLELVTAGPSPLLIAILVAIVLFGLSCCGIVILAGVARAWRAAAPAPRPAPGG